MKSFFKIFFASCLSFIFFLLLVVIVFSWIISSTISSEAPEVKSKSVLVLDLNKKFYEQPSEDFLALLTERSAGTTPGLYDVIRMLEYAKDDSSIEGLYIKANNNANAFGSSEELRNAIMNFKETGKFVIAYGETISQSAYYVASAADQIYCHPKGGLDWSGMSINYTFYKGLIDKLDIQPQIFYAGKFKSATEPFRVNKMTDPNKEQTTDLLNDIYGNFLMNTAQSRSLDTATLHQLAIDGKIRTSQDAVNARLLDGVMYDDQIRSLLAEKLGQEENDKINFLSFENYNKAADYKSFKGDKIALLYAEGQIIDGKTEAERMVASENFINLIRKIRLDDKTKAVVFRVNSPGGSAMASEGIWREITLLKEKKPVIVSMGDYAASGGYYISAAADSIFAEPGTLTGSIGVFGILPDLQKFFNNKLGITFDGVKTAPFADMGSANRPLTETEKGFIQASIDTVYEVFKSRVAQGRNLDMDYVDSIAQGHVYTGKRAIDIHLVDRIGYLPDAVNAAAAMAGVDKYWIKEYPEKKTLLQQLMGGTGLATIREKELRKSIGEEQFRYIEQIRSLQQMSNGVQARMITIPEIR